MQQVIEALGINLDNAPGACVGGWIDNPQGETLVSNSPIDGQPLGSVRLAGAREYETVVNASQDAFLRWRNRPAPQRGEVVRQLGELLRANKAALGRLVTLEMGKSLAEGEGEVQEMVDICDFAVGLSRQLYGLSMHSERPEHRMYEQWHPLGPIGVISAFNFPVAVWAWNAAIAAVAGNTVIWKPAPQTPLCALAVQTLCNQVMEQNDAQGVFNLVIGSVDDVAKPLVADTRLPLISATGSVAMGKSVAPIVASRLGRCLLELGGNNAIIVTQDADLELATRAVLFGAVGTAGQRCTTTRRLLLHKPIASEMTQRLLAAYQQLRIGNPLDKTNLVGPLISGDAVNAMMAALNTAKQQGGEVLFGGEEISNLPGGCYVRPALVRATPEMDILRHETFAPILYLVEGDSVDELIAMQNDVPQGLSSAMFSSRLQDAERFLSATGSDCGIANINIGTSGAEIGGAFGGEKDTGGGREAGSDAWKAYMRRQTVTINWSSELPLAQGIEFA